MLFPAPATLDGVLTTATGIAYSQVTQMRYNLLHPWSASIGFLHHFLQHLHEVLLWVQHRFSWPNCNFLKIRVYSTNRWNFASASWGQTKDTGAATFVANASAPSMYKLRVSNFCSKKRYPKMSRTESAPPPVLPSHDFFLQDIFIPARCKN